MASGRAEVAPDVQADLFLRQHLPRVDQQVAQQDLGPRHDLGRPEGPGDVVLPPPAELREEGVEMVAGDEEEDGWPVVRLSGTRRPRERFLFSRRAASQTTRSNPGRLSRATPSAAPPNPVHVAARRLQ